MDALFNNGFDFKADLTVLGGYVGSFSVVHASGSTKEQGGPLPPAQDLAGDVVPTRIRRVSAQAGAHRSRTIRWSVAALAKSNAGSSTSLFGRHRRDVETAALKPRQTIGRIALRILF